MGVNYMGFSEYVGIDLSEDNKKKRYLSDGYVRLATAVIGRSVIDIIDGRQDAIYFFMSDSKEHKKIRKHWFSLLRHGDVMLAEIRKAITQYEQGLKKPLQGIARRIVSARKDTE